MKSKLFLFANIVFVPLISANILNINTMESNFKQTIINDQNSKIQYTGKMYAKKEQNQALWEYKTPVEKQIYYTEGKLVIIEPELEQVIFAKLDKIPNILELLKNAQRISDDTLKTKFNSTTYFIKVNHNKIDSISYTDDLQNKVVISFIDEKVNNYISNDRFTYVIPKDFDILEQK